MTDWVVLWDWVMIAVRWLHVITAIAWIGSSFYFIALDLGLTKARDPARGRLGRGMAGPRWRLLPHPEIHGGAGAYARAPDLVQMGKLHDLAFRLRHAVPGLLHGGQPVSGRPNGDGPRRPGRRSRISMGSLALGWVMYDQICKSRFGDDNTRLMIGLYVILVLMAWGYVHVFSGRAAMLHLGAFTATVMTGERLLRDHPEPEGGGGRPDRRPHPRSEIREDRQAAVDAQQLPDASGPVPDAVEPLPADLRDAIQLDHREPRLPDGGDDPALVQHPPRRPRQPALDLARHRDPVPDHRLALDRADAPPAAASKARRPCRHLCRGERL